MSQSKVEQEQKMENNNNEAEKEEKDKVPDMENNNDQQQQKLVRSETKTIETTIFPNYFIKQSQQKPSLDKIQEQINASSIKNKNLKVLYALGEGGQAQVLQVIDIGSRQLFAMKQYTDQQSFQREFNIMSKLHNLYNNQQQDNNNSNMSSSNESPRKQEDIENKFKIDSIIDSQPQLLQPSSLIAELYDVDENTFKLYYESGLCSLAEFNDYMVKYDISWFDKEIREKQLNFIIKTIFQIIISFSKKNFYHGDIKPENIILVNSNGSFSQLVPKLIDVGVSSFEYKQVAGFSKIYNTEKTTYQSRQSRLQGELFQLGRTLQSLMLSSIQFYEQKKIQVLDFTQHHQYISKHHIKVGDLQYFVGKDSKSIEKSIEKSKEFFSENIVEVVQMLLAYKTPQIDVIQEKIDKLETLPIDDSLNFVHKIMKKKIESRFQEEKEIKAEKIEKEIEECLKLSQLQICINLFEKYQESHLELKKNPKMACIKQQILKFLGRDKQLKEFTETVIKPNLNQYSKLDPKWYNDILIELIYVEDDKDKKIEHVFSVLDYYNDKDQFQLARTYVQIAKVLSEAYLLQKSMEYLEKALAIYKNDKNKFFMQDEIQYQLQMGFALTIKGEVLRLKTEKNEKYQQEVVESEIEENLQESKLVLEQALVIFERNNHKKSIRFGYLIFCMAQTEYAMKQIQSALIYYKQALEVFKYSIGERNFYFTWTLNRLSHVYKELDDDVNCLKCQEQAWQVIKKIGFDGQLRDTFFQNLIDSYEKHAGGIAEYLEQSWVEWAEKFENQFHYHKSMEFLNIALEFLPKVPETEEEQEKEDNLEDMPESYGNQLDLRDYLIEKLEIIKLKEELKTAQKNEEVVHFTKVYTQICEKTNDKPEFKADQILAKQQLAKYYVQHNLEPKKILHIIEGFLPHIKQNDFPEEFTIFVFTLAILNDNIRHYERSFHLLQTCQKFVTKYKLNHIQSLIDQKHRGMEKNARDARDARILYEKKQKYNNLKQQKGPARSCDIVRIGLNIANIYQKDNMLEESELMINEVLEFQENSKTKIFPEEKHINEFIYSSSNLQSPRSRSLSPTGISSVKGLKSVQNKHNFEAAVKQLHEQQQQQEKDKEEDIDWSENCNQISQSSKSQYITKQKQHKQAELMLNRIREQKIIKQIQNRKRPVLKFVNKKRQFKDLNENNNNQLQNDMVIDVENSNSAAKMNSSH